MNFPLQNLDELPAAVVMLFQQQIFHFKNTAEIEFSLIGDKQQLV